MSVPFWGYPQAQEEAKRMERQLAKTFRLGEVIISINLRNID